MTVSPSTSSPRIGDVISTAPPPHSHPASTPPDPATEATTGESTAMIRPWIDPIVDELGHDPRSAYVEQFWLGVLGPTATWVLRRLTNGLAEHPDGYTLDLASTARSMGLSYRTGRSSPFSKALLRCTMFGLAHQTSDGFAVRRRIPQVAQRHLRRLPPGVQRAHDTFEATATSVDHFDRAHRLAMAMLEVGDDAATIEHQLRSLGIGAAAAALVAENAAQL
ncbi:MAG: hypothetical protein AB8G26_15540 [Ilumatobacter sp.]